MEPAAVRTALVRIGFVDAAAQAIVEEQGIDSLDEIRLLSDDEITNLGKLLRRPGGTVPGAAGAGGPAVPNPGIQVNARAETNLKLLAFYLRHKLRTSRTVAPAAVTLESIRSIRELRDFEATYKPSDDVPTINAKDWPKTMESILEYLRSYLGDKKIPLAYVVRKDENVPEMDPDGGYATVQDEMIARAPHFTMAGAVRTLDPTFLVNREKVWEIIARITREHSCWTYVKPAQRTRDGRMAYLALYTHFLGPNNVDNMATLAEDKLKSTVYNGEQRRWDFEKYVNVHKQQHSIMEGLVEHGYTGIDPRSKVRYLLDGIKTDKFDSVKTRIMSDATLRNDFDGCVTLYQDFMKQTGSKTKGNPNVNISEVKVHNGGKRKRSDEAEDRYYTKSEYDALSPAQKKDLAAKRLKRGHKPGAKDSKTKKDRDIGKGNNDAKGVIKNLKAVNRTVAQLAKQMGKVDVGTADDVTDASESSNETQPRTVKPVSSSNRTNSSLTRQANKNTK
ncbi:hypothetical protein MHU86_10403 [Fragilaria crotonensis]|nr:hypothetical protein MHU86_10403 [Fragilaria crotonensis]